MTPKQKARLEAMSMQGRIVTFKDKGSSSRTQIGEVVDEVYIMVGDYKHMIQRIKFLPGVSWDDSDCGYRPGYYTFDGQGKQIKWGQFTQFLTETEYQTLLAKAR